MNFPPVPSKVKEVSRRRGEVTNTRFINVTVPPFQYEVPGLKAMTWYNLSVSCSNEVGASPLSMWIQSNTTEGGVWLLQEPWNSLQIGYCLQLGLQFQQINENVILNLILSSTFLCVWLFEFRRLRMFLCLKHHLVCLYKSGTLCVMIPLPSHHSRFMLWLQESRTV